MKQQIARISPHQNGKVLGVLMALSSLVFVVPFTLFSIFAAPQGSGPSGFFLVLLPIFYLVMGYLTVAVACWLYNHLYKSLGGIEFEAQAINA